MTELLYNLDSYMKEFEGTVLICEEKIKAKDLYYDIVLDRTCFFPEQGGQESDTGCLNSDSTESLVSHVSIKDNIIHHICEKPIPVGSKVKGCINFEERYDKMQQHSGEHIVSGTIHRLHGFDNVGFHLSSREVTLDFNGQFTDEELLNIENIANEAVYKNFESVITVPTPEELANINYRSKKELKGDIRIVEFPGYDICACCAPHVKFTGEIGMIKIISAEHFKGGTRISIKCGKRALDAFRALLNDARTISRITSAKLEDIAPTVQKISDSLKEAKFKSIMLERRILDDVVEKAISDNQKIIRLESGDNDSIRAAVNKLTSAFEGICGVFVGNDETGYRFIISSKTADCKEFGNSVKDKLNLKGGGSKDMLQGTVSVNFKTILEVFDTV